MEVKSMARVKYSYNIEGVSLSGLSQSNIVTTEIRKLSLLVKKLANTEYYKPQDIITYTIILNNTGTIPINNICLDDNICNQYFILDSLKAHTLDNIDIDPTYELIEDSIKINIDMIKPNQTIILIYKTLIGPCIDKIKAELKVDTDEIKDISPQEIELKQGFVQIECVKRVSNEYAFLNTDLSYELLLINKGNINAYNLEIFDELPVTYELSEENHIIINDNPINYNYIDNILSFVLPELPANSSITVQINGKIIK